MSIAVWHLVHIWYISTLNCACCNCCYDVIRMTCNVCALLKSIFGPTVEEIIGQVELLRKELHDVFLWPFIAAMIKSRKVKWAGNVACINVALTRHFSWKSWRMPPPNECTLFFFQSFSSHSEYEPYFELFVSSEGFPTGLKTTRKKLLYLHICCFVCLV